VAMRGRGVPGRAKVAVAKRLLWYLVRRPFAFLYPPAGEVAPEHAHH